MDNARMPKDTVGARVLIKGLVQGVYFRAGTKKTAARYAVTGWVRNNKDGSVEAVFEGQKEDVERAIAWCKDGPPGARVDKVEVSWLEKIEGCKGFHLDYESV